MATILLICSVLASLAFGVLVAYGLCHTMFRVFRVQSQHVARRRQEAAARIAPQTSVALPAA